MGEHQSLLQQLRPSDDILLETPPKKAISSLA
jgi:hypothetical protein